MNPPTGILLYNLGGPSTLDEVEPFLVELFSDRDIIALPAGAPFQTTFGRALAKWRAPSVRENYRLIGGGSPLKQTTVGQGARLEARLGSDFRVFIAMRYLSPRIADALDKIQAEGITRVIALSLFPHWSKATTGSFQKELRRVVSSSPWARRALDITHIDRYATEPLYLEALADTVRRALDRFQAASRSDVVVLFSAHGLPQALVDRGDPYVAEIEATRAGLWARLGLRNRQLLGYQSRVGPVRWIGPGTDELIDRLGTEGVRQVLVVPLSFVSDHIETLYEIDILFAERAKRAGIREFRRTDSLNGHPGFIGALAELVERHVAAENAAPAVARIS